MYKVLLIDDLKSMEGMTVMARNYPSDGTDQIWLMYRVCLSDKGEVILVNEDLPWGVHEHEIATRLYDVLLFAPELYFSP